MADRQFLFIDQSLMDKIDRRRGDLSCNEFVESCVNSFLGEAGDNLSRPARRARRRSDERIDKSESRTSGKSSLIFMDKDLLNQIDESRGAVSRAEFIEHCISSRFPKLTSRQKSYATREEFQEFKGFVKDTLKELADIIFHSNEPVSTEKYPDSAHQTRRGFSETSEPEGSRCATLPPRPRSGEYRRDAYRTQRRASPERTGERPYPEDHEPPYRGRSDRFASEDRRESPEYPPPTRDSRRLSTDDGYPPPPRQNVGDGSPQNRGNLRGVISNLKQRLQGWLFTQEAPAPVPGARPPATGQVRHSEHDVSRREVSRYDVSRREVISSEAPAATVMEAEDTAPQKMHPGLWALAILLFGFGDTLLSTMVFAKGGYEANPLMGNLIAMFGGSIVAFVIIKTVIMGVLALISFKVFKNQGWLIPSILIVVGTFLVLSNLMAYVKL